MNESAATRQEHDRLGTLPIDGLRGFAILLVVLYHTWLFSWLDPSFAFFGKRIPFYAFVRPGYLGVDMFFVISAFCLAFPYATARVRRTPYPSLAAFAVRRAIKIVPSYALCLIVTLLVALQAHSVARADFSKVVIEHALFVQNIEYDRLGHDNSVLWSLAVEVQFYVAFPLIVRLFAVRPTVTAAMMIASAQAYRWINASCCLRDENVMRLLPAYLDLFAVGIGAAWLVALVPFRAPRLAEMRWLFTGVGALGVAGLIATLFSADANTYVKDSREWFAVGQRTIFGGCVGLAAVGSCLGYDWWKRTIGNRVLTGLSVVSYNLYLWHTLVELYLAHHNIPHASTKEPHEDPTWSAPFVALSFVTVAAVSVAITYLFERPLLSLIKPQSFAFPYRRVLRRFVEARMHPAGGDPALAERRPVDGSASWRR